MNSVVPQTITFKDIEKRIFEFGCEISRNMISTFLADVDKEICETRNKAEYRHKGYRNTTIKTLMGEVPVKRTLYKRILDDGTAEYVFLLDKELGFDTIGNISPNLVEKIAGQICEESYRAVSGTVTGLTNQSISHQGVWNVVQAIGERQAKTEKQLMTAFKDDRLSGDKKVPVLFEEADGLSISIQKRDGKKGKKKRSELKAGIIYEGWKKRYLSSKEYETVEKMVIAGFMDPEEFKCLRDSRIAQRYDFNSITHRILNGDGAKWIKEGHDAGTDIAQLDQFHIKRCVIRNVSDKRAAGYISRLLKAGRCDEAILKIEELKYECGGEEKEIKRLRALESYIKNNRNDILVYKDRAGIKLPEAPEGIEYRSLGTMEGNMDIFSSRMKGGKSWSIKGADNLARIIALKAEKGFKEKIAALGSNKISERFTERFKEEIKNTTKKVSVKVKDSIYPLHRGAMPFTDCYVTNGRKAVRKMFDLKPFTEMTYR